MFETLTETNESYIFVTVVHPDKIPIKFFLPRYYVLNGSCARMVYVHSLQSFYTGCTRLY